MMRVRDVAALFIAISITLSAMVAHGWIRSQWLLGGTPEERGTAVQNMPQEFDGWVRKVAKEFPSETLEVLECSPNHCFDHVYFNPELNATVEIAVFFGPAGPVAVHTPDICYRNSDFKIIKSDPLEVGDDKLRLLLMESNAVDKTQMHVAYAWRHGDHWEVSDSPRFAFAFKRHLYKLQLATADTPAPSEEASTENSSEEDSSTEDGTEVPPVDPIAVKFLQSFLPAFEQHVIQNGP